MANTPKWKQIENKFEAFKAKIPVVMQECIEDYALDLCHEGLEDFMGRLGLKWEQPQARANVTIKIENILLPGAEGYRAPFTGITEFDCADERLEDDLRKHVADFLTNRFPKAEWDEDFIEFTVAD